MQARKAQAKPFEKGFPARPAVPNLTRHESAFLSGAQASHRNGDCRRVQVTLKIHSDTSLSSKGDCHARNAMRKTDVEPVPSPTAWVNELRLTFDGLRECDLSLTNAEISRGEHPHKNPRDDELSPRL